MKREFDIEFFKDVGDLSPYLGTVGDTAENPPTVRYTPYRYTGWRRWWRRLTFRSVESDTYEFEAVIVPNEPFLPTREDEDVTGFSYSMKPIGEIRKVSEGK